MLTRQKWLEISLFNLPKKGKECIMGVITGN